MRTARARCGVDGRSIVVRGRDASARGGVRARARGWMTTTRAARDARAADADAEETTAVKLLTSDESENLLKIRHTVRVCRSFRVVG